MIRKGKKPLTSEENTAAAVHGRVLFGWLIKLCMVDNFFILLLLIIINFIYLAFAHALLYSKNFKKYSRRIFVLYFMKKKNEHFILFHMLDGNISVCMRTRLYDADFKKKLTLTWILSPRAPVQTNGLQYNNLSYLLCFLLVINGLSQTITFTKHK